MARLRDRWAVRPHGLGRAARHYERACQLLTCQCVFTAPVGAPSPFPHAAAIAAVSQASGAGPWVSATAPARVDLAGGWSDTPPITYEAPPTSGGGGSGVGGAGAAHGGMLDATATTVGEWCARGGGLVVNAAISVDGRRPLGARVRRVALPPPTAPGGRQPLVVIRTRGEAPLSASRVAAATAQDPTAPPGTAVVSTVTLSSLGDLADYCQPRSEGALVKCALLVLPGLVDITPGSPPLEAQLAAALGQQTAPDGSTATTTTVGLEIETWSLLPTGSGLGTSSILAGTLLAALAGALGRSYDPPSLNHAVLGLEGMLSTGGGWQDQVGGLLPGVKASSCAPCLPLEVAAISLDGGGGSVGAPRLLSDRLFLVYTGKTRLAKNLLQTVLRQWAGRDEGVTSTVAGLRNNAVAAARALAGGDADAVGSCLGVYWEQKKTLATNAEPPEVALMRSVLAPHVTGSSLAGAGGGGFLVGLARVPGPDVAARMEALLRGHASTAGLPFSVHAAAVDTRGLVVAVEGHGEVAA